MAQIDLGKTEQAIDTTTVAADMESVDEVANGTPYHTGCRTEAAEEYGTTVSPLWGLRAGGRAVQRPRSS